MSKKLCFNCYEPLETTSDTCTTCGAVILEESPKEILKSNNITNTVENIDLPIFFRYTASITIFTGTLQVFMARYVDLLSQLANEYGSNYPFSPWVMIIVGLLYSFGVVTLFKSQKLKLIYLLINIIQVFSLIYLMSSISRITFIFDLFAGFTSGTTPLSGYTTIINQFRITVYLLTILMILQTIFMYSSELSKLNVRG